MSDEQDKLKLSLEAPKLFGRKKQSAETAPTSKDGPAESAQTGTPAKKTAKKAPAKKAAAKKTAAKKTAAKSASSAKTTAKKVTAKKTSAKVEATGVAKDTAIDESVETTVETPIEQTGTTEPDTTATKVMPAVTAEPAPPVDVEPEDVEPEAVPEPGAEPEPPSALEPEPEPSPELVEPDPDPEPEPDAVLEPEPVPDAAEAEDTSADEAKEPLPATSKSRWAARLGRKAAKATAAEPDDALADDPDDAAGTKVDGAAVATAHAGPDADADADAGAEPILSAEREDAEIAAMVEQDDEAVDQGPLLTTYWAAVVTGLVVGSAMVFFTWLALRGCESVRGTSSCGGGPGFALLIITFALCVIIGRSLLKAFTLPDPGSSSFLAVGFVAVIALMFLIDIIDHWSMIIIVPLLSIAGYAASVWITKTFVEPADS